MRSFFPDDENPWDWANRGRIGGLAGGLIGAGLAIAFARSSGALAAGIAIASVVLGALIGIWLPYRPR